jgi:hypothetical protein
MSRGKGLDLSPPRMISDGPRKTYREIEWPDNQKFFRVTDLQTGSVYFGTSVEARLRCCASVDGFRSAVKTGRKMSKGRYVAESIPRFLFVRNTSRTHDSRWDYYDKW